jgi:hypothetical protein
MIIIVMIIIIQYSRNEPNLGGRGCGGYGTRRGGEAGRIS